MNRKFKGLMTVASSALAVTVVFAHVPNHDPDLFCNNVSSLSIDSSLPVSHPTNRCAMESSKGISWSSWFSGKSHGYQFHYLDLLELLSRSTESTHNTSNRTR